MANNWTREDRNNTTLSEQSLGPISDSKPVNETAIRNHTKALENFTRAIKASGHVVSQTVGNNPSVPYFRASAAGALTGTPIAGYTLNKIMQSQVAHQAAEALKEKLYNLKYNSNLRSKRKAQERDLILSENFEARNKYHNIQKLSPSKKKLALDSLPKAAEGGYVKKTGVAVVHKGEGISPTNLIEKQVTILSQIQRGQAKQSKELQLMAESQASSVSQLKDFLSDPEGNAPSLAKTLGGLAVDITVGPLFRGKYVSDIQKSKNPLITQCNALIQIYRWQRLYGELSKQQLNELIKLQGGQQKDVEGKRAVLLEWAAKNTKELKIKMAKYRPGYDAEGNKITGGKAAMARFGGALSRFGVGGLRLFSQDWEGVDTKQRRRLSQSLDRWVGIMTKNETDPKKRNVIPGGLGLGGGISELFSTTGKSLKDYDIEAGKSPLDMAISFGNNGKKGGYGFGTGDNNKILNSIRDLVAAIASKMYNLPYAQLMAKVYSGRRMTFKSERKSKGGFTDKKKTFHERKAERTAKQKSKVVEESKDIKTVHQVQAEPGAISHIVANGQVARVDPKDSLIGTKRGEKPFSIFESMKGLLKSIRDILAATQIITQKEFDEVESQNAKIEQRAREERKRQLEEDRKKSLWDRLNRKKEKENKKSTDKEKSKLSVLGTIIEFVGIEKLVEYLAKSKFGSWLGKKIPIIGKLFQGSVKESKVVSGFGKVAGETAEAATGISKFGLAITKVTGPLLKFGKLLGPIGVALMAIQAAAGTSKLLSKKGRKETVSEFTEDAKDVMKKPGLKSIGWAGLNLASNPFGWIYATVNQEFSLLNDWIKRFKIHRNLKSQKKTFSEIDKMQMIGLNKDESLIEKSKLKKLIMTRSYDEIKELMGKHFNADEINNIIEKRKIEENGPKAIQSLIREFGQDKVMPLINQGINPSKVREIITGGIRGQLAKRDAREISKLIYFYGQNKVIPLVDRGMTVSEIKEALGYKEPKDLNAKEKKDNEAKKEKIKKDIEFDEEVISKLEHKKGRSPLEEDLLKNVKKDLEQRREKLRSINMESGAVLDESTHGKDKTTKTSVQESVPMATNRNVIQQVSMDISSLSNKKDKKSNKLFDAYDEIKSDLFKGIGNEESSLLVLKNQKQTPNIIQNIKKNKVLLTSINKTKDKFNESFSNISNMISNKVPEKVNSIINDTIDQSKNTISESYPKTFSRDTIREIKTQEVLDQMKAQKKNIEGLGNQFQTSANKIINSNTRVISNIVNNTNTNISGSGGNNKDRMWLSFDSILTGSILG